MNGVLVFERKIPREMRPHPSARVDRQEAEQERCALRKLIDGFRSQPGSDDEGGFYRNAGRIIAHPSMKPHWPGDKKH
jgi:hypothetical protein